MIIQSWCPGQGCDPCKPPVSSAAHLFIIGSTHASPGPLIYLSAYTQYDSPTFLTLTGTLTIKATSSLPEVAPQTYSLSITASGYFQSGETAVGMPLPATDTGIVVDSYTNPLAISAQGPVVMNGPLAFSLYEVPIPTSSP